MRLLALLIASMVAAGCATAGPSRAERSPSPADPASPAAALPATRSSGAPLRPVPNPIEYPEAWLAAVERGTRTREGSPGPRYWQQYARYQLTARIDAEQRRLDGTAAITYFNRSPDSLPVLHLDLVQNVHDSGAMRLEPMEVTGGMRLRRVAVNGAEMRELGDTDPAPGHVVFGTRLLVAPPRALQAGDSVRLDIEWSFTIPQQGASGRMGWSDDMFFIAYWYPQMTVYDDVIGWHPDAFLGPSEFYHGFADYELTVDAPAGWLVRATGRHENPEATLSGAALERLRVAESSDTAVRIADAATLGAALRQGTRGRLQWRFRADSVRDIAFSANRRAVWEAARTRVGDRNGDGSPDFSRVEAVWRETAPRWQHMVRYEQHAIDFLSRYTGIAYPWPHMTAIEGGGIIGGGMEFPMMTLIGDYNAQGDSALYWVTAHELAHMWVPMMVGSDERRHAWFDEGTTTYNENMARMEFFPGTNHHLPDQRAYVGLAQSAREGEILRWSNYHYSPAAYGIASYQKPATVMRALRAVLGDETFHRGYRQFLRQWSYRHPTPWDFFRTMETVSGRNLGWFWRAWYAETWQLDQAIASVTATPAGTRIVVEDRGDVPMPVRLALTRPDGTVERREIPVDVWLAGERRAELVVPGTVTRVEIDPESVFPDVDRGNNGWMGGAATGAGSIRP